MKRLLIAAALASMPLASAARAAGNRWNGTWTLDTSRPEPDGAASDYRFTITPDERLRWKIPSLKENNPGRLDGTPMRINRPVAPPGLTMGVWSTAPDVLRHKVALNGRARGEGRMTLAADGRSWTDVPLDRGRPVKRLTMVYRRS